MKKLYELCTLFIILILLNGCAAKHKKVIELKPDLNLSGPVNTGMAYLENILKPEYKTYIYDLISENTKYKLSMDDFAGKISQLGKTIDVDEMFTDVIPLNIFIFSDDKVVCYYLMVYEKEKAGVYFLVEMYLENEMGWWKVNLTENQDELFIVPVIEQGDISELTRRTFMMMEKSIENRMDEFRKEFKVEDMSKESVTQEDKYRLIKKEKVVGKVYFEIGNFEKARDSFEKILSLNPEDQEAKEFLEKSLKAIKQREQELKEAEEKAKKEREKQEALRQKPVEKKVESAKKEKPLEDQLFEKSFMAGKELYDSGEYRKAIIEFKKSLGFKPQNIEVKNYIRKCERAIQVKNQ